MSRWFRLYDGVLDDPKVQRLPDAAFRAWVNLLCLASRNDGRIEEANAGFSLRLDEAQMGALLAILTAAGLLEREGEDLTPHNWKARQFKSDVSTPRVKQLRKQSHQKSETPPETDTETEPETESDTDQIAAGAARFEEFWSVYPRKVGKGAAEKSFLRSLKLTDADALIAGMQRYAGFVAGRNPRFTCHPATWLNQQRWLDEGIGPPPEADEAGARATWDGAAAPLVDEIGAASFHAYFARANFSPGPPARLVMDKPYLKVLVERKFSGALRRAYGDVTVEVS